MRVLSGEEILDLLPMRELIEQLRIAFLDPCVCPDRQITALPGGSGDRLLLYMPAFDPAGAAVVKLATILPENPARGLPAIQAAILVFSPSGTPIAVLDGAAVTRMRTGAASALASSYLSRPDSARLLVIGTGALAPCMAWAHCTVRPIRQVWVSGRDERRTRATVEAIGALVGAQVHVEVADSLDRAAAEADVISCATSSAEPVLQGAWIRPGTFIDLVGSFSPIRREADDEVMRRSRLFVDTFEGALAEAGDLLDPIGRGVITREQIEGELADLVSGRVTGRSSADEITLFKSVGSAIEDLAAAQLLMAQFEAADRG
ncbi:MAG TPA: ornithine cyclodeaminase family protein [Steroidobacteraceae bacterium]|jgi:ornithine cyclodeaminase|nr:ornithine cyclodeaminase family protein [Steroidobacteraceae bacterium]